MAITGVYTILMRRGEFADFVPEKLKPGEWAVVLSGDPNVSDGRAIYHCFASGVVKRIATLEDMESVFEEMADNLVTQITDEVESATNAANQAAQYANNAGGEAYEQAQAAETAKNQANATVQDILDRLENGEFTGPVGPPGEAGADGANGVITTLDGMIAFQVRDGKLYMSYFDGTEPPDAYIAGNGHLILNIE